MIYSASLLSEKINSYIASLGYSRPPEGLYAPIEYVLSLGGKRIRPVLMLMAYNLYKDDVESIFPSAAAIEMYHNYTLLHDDLMDKAEMRRNKPTVHKVWNENAAILSGDTMLVLAYKLMAQCDSKYLKTVLDVFTDTALEIGEGQQYDMDFEMRNDVTEAEYIEMIRLKTSVLLAASLKIGAIQAGASDEDARYLYDFGVQAGLAFQLQDDYLDVYGDAAVFGKRIGGDILCNKKTYMLINTYLMANAEQRQSLETWIQKKQYVEDEKIAAVTAIYDAVGIRDVCSRKINEYFEKALQSLSLVNMPTDRKKELQAFISSLMNRAV